MPRIDLYIIRCLCVDKGEVWRKSKLAVDAMMCKKLFDFCQTFPLSTAMMCKKYSELNTESFT